MALLAVNDRVYHLADRNVVDKRYGKVTRVFTAAGIERAEVLYEHNGKKLISPSANLVKVQ